MDRAQLHALIERAQGGDMQAFRQIYDAHLRRVAAQVGRLLGPRGDVEDVVQEVFIQVHRSLPNFRGDSEFTTWLYRVTWNVAVTHLRRRVNHTPVDLPALMQFACEKELWGKLEARDKLRTLYAALEELPDEYREAFILFEIEGNSLQEIAEMTDTSLNTIASRVRRSRERLRALLESVESSADQAAQGARS